MRSLGGFVRTIRIQSLMLLLVICAAGANAQYIVGTGNASFPGDIYHTGGKVGLGTTNPGDLLSIQGGALSFANPQNPYPYVGMDYDVSSDALRFRINLGATVLTNTAWSSGARMAMSGSGR
jgi:hypothetical protein